MRTVKVEASKTYDITIQRGLLDSIGKRLADVLGEKTRLCIITDTNVDRLYSDRLKKALEGRDFEKYIVESGEESKCIRVWADILNFMCEKGFDRSSAVVAVGGGVVGDLAGFAASAFLRGVRFVQVPTTLLSAVDSSVGGKTAVDLPYGKNLCGTFWQPEAVLCDPDLTDTLTDEIFRDGMGEVIKYAVLSPKLPSDMLRGNVKDRLEDIIAASVEIKRDIVNEDEFDTGKRALLNFGHTAAHAIEKCSEYKISHGAAVAQGMVIAAKAAAAMGICSEAVAEEIKELTAANGINTDCPYSAPQLAAASYADKKRSGSKITLVLPEKMGSCILYPMDTDCLEAFYADGLK